MLKNEFRFTKKVSTKNGEIETSKLSREEVISKLK